MLREKETKKKLLNALECAADLEPENTKVEEKPSLEDVFINEDDIFDIKVLKQEDEKNLDLIEKIDLSRREIFISKNIMTKK